MEQYIFGCVYYKNFYNVEKEDEMEQKVVMKDYLFYIYDFLNLICKIIEKKENEKGNLYLQ